MPKNKRLHHSILSRLSGEDDQEVGDKSQTTPADKQVETKPRFGRFSRISDWSKPRKWFVGSSLVVLIILLLVGLVGGYTYFQARQIQTLAEELNINGQVVYQSAKNQDLVAANQALDQVKSDLSQLETVYNRLGFYAYLPIVRPYYLDGKHGIEAGQAGAEAGSILLDTVEPYADVLGFTGQGSFTGGTAEERIVKIIETMDKVVPALDQVAQQIQIVQQNLDQIDPDRYQFIDLRGKPASEWLIQAQDLSQTAYIGVTDVKPLLEVIPSVAGLEETKTYLVIFQNDAEIRPTGGFMTAYGILRVDKGKVSQVKSDDIYTLDDKFNSRIPAPDPITTYLDNVNYWHLRDMNLSPDFAESMDTFMQHYRTLPGEPGDEIDGIVAVDTQVLSDLITVLGPTDVPGFGTFTAEIDPRCDCPQVIYELEDFATRPRGYIRTDRKSFLAPMLQTLLLKAYGSPKEVWPQLFEIVVANVVEKHVLFNMFDENTQAAVEQVNIGGRIQDYQGDYLHINNTNLGGAKSNLFIEDEVELNITTTETGTEHQLEITYRNPAPASNCNLEAGQLCLNGVYRDWTRIYLPAGSEVIETQGFQQGSVEVGTGFDRVELQGFFTFAPQSQAKLVIRYTTPYLPEADNYQLYIQKQPGKKIIPHTVTINQEVQEVFDLKSDKLVQLEL